MDTKKILSASFLLRLWQVETNGDFMWRASLESSQTGERWGFANVEAMFDFLARRTVPQATQADRAPADRAPADRRGNQHSDKNFLEGST